MRVRLGECFDLARNEALNPDQSANLREMQRQWKQAICFARRPRVEARSLAASRCEHDWRRQRADNDWSGFLPRFEHLVSLVRQEARARLKPVTPRIKHPTMPAGFYAPGESNDFIARFFRAQAATS